MREEAIVQAGERRSARIEALRALAALAVLESHAFGLHYAFYGPALEDGYLHRLFLGGSNGVFLFFALTGYLLYLPFARRDFGPGQGIDLRSYGVNRALRILPLYYVVVVVLLLVQEHGGTGEQWWRFLLFGQNFSVRTIDTVDSPMWSLVVEIQFYLLLPLLAWLLGRVGGRRLGRAFLLLTFLAAVSALSRREASQGVLTSHNLWRQSLPGTFFFFYGGMVIAMVRVRWEQRRPAWLDSRWASPDVFLAAAVALACLAQLKPSLRADLMVTAAGGLVVGAVVLPLRPGRIVRVLDWRPLAVVGIASYSLYLWHVPIMTLFSPRMPWPVLMLIGIAVSVPVALVSYRLVEAPFLALRRRWYPRREPAAATPRPRPAARAAELEVNA